VWRERQVALALRRQRRRFKAIASTERVAARRQGAILPLPSPTSATKSALSGPHDITWVRPLSPSKRTCAMLRQATHRPIMLGAGSPLCLLTWARRRTPPTRP
jgi:hypothetical protein